MSSEFAKYISDDKCHIGHVVFDYLKRSPDVVCQIDAATGEEESYASVLSRSIRLAQSLRRFGLKPGDVLAVGGRNHLDLHIPFYAGLFNGLPIVGVDPYFKYDEVRTLFKLTEPKIAFCQWESCSIYQKAANDLDLDLKIVTFDEGECTMTKFMKQNGGKEAEDDFRVQDFDTDKIYAFLISTSGTTGKVKVAAFNHRPFLLKCIAFAQLISSDFQKGIMSELNLSPVQWISSFHRVVNTPLMRCTKIQTSKQDDLDHIIDIINRYKPFTTLFTPTLLAFLISRKEDVDLSCFKIVGITGSKVYSDVLKQFKALLKKDAILKEAYGQTEMIGPVLAPNPLGPSGNCGRPMPGYSIKLVHPDTGAEISEPNVTGEVLTKGLGFKEYYNDPEETAKAFTEDGYFRTGDLLYRDENNNYFFVDRIKTLIKYQNSHVIPSELEEVILTLPGVKDVCVIGIPDIVDGQLPVACVVKRENSNVTAQEIKDIVSRNLSKNKKLRGGVVFLDAIPQTSTGKIAQMKLRQIVMDSNRE